MGIAPRSGGPIKTSVGHKEVARLVCLFFFFFMAACSVDTKEEETFVEPSTVGCSNAAVENQFLIRWKDGSISRITADNRESFLKDIFDKEKSNISRAEHDYLITLDQPITTSEIQSSEVVDPIWGTDKVQAPDVWAEGVEGEGIVVAVIDSGVDINQAQLADTIYINPGEIAGNGIDDDGNKFIDDVKGWDFANDIAEMVDENSHGTHVAGIVSATHTTDPSLNLGMAPKAKIMPLRFMDADGGGLISDALDAIDYAANNGADIINASWGGAACSSLLETKIQELEAKNILFMAASGNEFRNLDTSPIFPAAYPNNPTQLTIAASTEFDFIAAFSNVSPNLVHLVAPGKDIFSTVPDALTGGENPVGNIKSGTSMATPFVAGAAALIWSKHKEATALQVRQAILDSVDVDEEAFGSSTITNGRLNAKKALDALAAALLP